MTPTLEQYAEVAGRDAIQHLQQLAGTLAGASVLHVNSTRTGGGVAEILLKLVPLMQELGLACEWKVITGTPEFFNVTKAFHNAIQGRPVDLPKTALDAYERVSAENADRLRPELEAADFVIVHDPQPAMLLGLCPNRKGKWIWRCHTDLSRPFRPVWKYLRNHVAPYDASVFSLARFAQPLPHAKYIIPPSIDPLSEKNIPLDSQEVDSICAEFGIDRGRPLLLQVSRFDRFKDPVGVIRAYRLVKKHVPSVQLVLAGSEAEDDPEGAGVLAEVRAAAGTDADVKVLLLRPDAHRTINALQRAADIVLQKSIREGFGLTVSDAMWKGKPVIGGNTGGIRLQVTNAQTGYLVDTPEGAALRTRFLLDSRGELEKMGAKAREFVRENFLLTRHVREYLTLLVALRHGCVDRIELG